MSNKQLIVGGIKQKDTDYLTRAYDGSALGNNEYVAQQSATQIVNENYGIKRTVYHSQAIFNSSAIDCIVPFFEIIPTVAGTQYDFGKVILKIRFVGNTSATTSLFEIVGTDQDGSTANDTTKLTGSTLSSGTTVKTMAAGTIGTTHNTGITIAGEISGTLKTYELDLDTYLKANDTTVGNTVNLGLKVLSSGAGKFALEAHVELIEPNYDLYVSSHTMA